MTYCYRRENKLLGLFNKESVDEHNLEGINIRFVDHDGNRYDICSASGAEAVKDVLDKVNEHSKHSNYLDLQIELVYGTPKHLFSGTTRPPIVPILPFLPSYTVINLTGVDIHVASKMIESLLAEDIYMLSITEFASNGDPYKLRFFIVNKDKDITSLDVNGGISVSVHNERSIIRSLLKI